MASAPHDMVAIARSVLVEQGFAPDRPEGIERTIPAHADEPAVDLRGLPWSSIDNSDSRDLDQIEVAEEVGGGAVRLRVGIADVDAYAPRETAVDRAAWTNAATLYTGVHIFPMLPEVLSTDRTSLLGGKERLAIVIEMVVRPDGTLDDAQTKLYAAHVVNHAQLAYDPVGAWLAGDEAALHVDPVIAAQLRLQDRVASRLRELRHRHGALELDMAETRTITKDGRLVDIELAHQDRASHLIAELMIAANGAAARYLEAHGRSSMRRVVRAPKRWDRIVELAAGLGTQLPAAPDAPALARFVESRRAADPARFPELSLAIVKLLGPGIYALQRATDPDQGHFGLAVDDYAHSTAPNRRFADLVTQRLLKATAAGVPPPYSDDDLAAIAQHCTERADAARKVERTMRKVEAAALLEGRVGLELDGIVTGATPKGTFVRTEHPVVEGRVVRGEHGLDVGDHVRVRLVRTDVAQGYIDFERA